MSKIKELFLLHYSLTDFVMARSIDKATTLMTISYSQIRLDDYHTIAEKPASYSYFTEQHLQAIWMEQKYFTLPKTADGRRIEIVSPGIWNSGAGPDFLKAHCKIGDAVYFGDIELHLNSDGWIHHGHQEDVRYNQVVLHVVLWNSAKERPTIKQDGHHVPTIFLEDFLNIPIARIAQLVDLDLYPYRKFVGSGRCSQGLFRKIGSDQTLDLFQSAALCRLEEKKCFLDQWVSRPELRLPAGIAMGLGYKHNTLPFLELFNWISTDLTRTEDEVYALLLGASGFFEERYLKKWKESSDYQKLQDIWMTLHSSVFHQAQLRMDQVRPLNHPIRRLAYLAKLACDPLITELESQLQRCWSSNWQLGLAEKTIKVLRNLLLEHIPNYTDPFWNAHFTFSSSSSPTLLPLMGESLRQEILVNTLLPLLYDTIKSKKNEGGLTAFLGLYHSIRAKESGKARYLTHRFFGDSPKGDLLKGAISQQGAYQVHKDFCVHYESSCDGCPFVDRYNP